jgi:exodeoxyribonuclease VII large subunit
MTEKLRTARAHLGDPMRVVQIKTQQIDFIAHRLGGVALNLIAAHYARLNQTVAGLRHPRQVLLEKQRTLIMAGERLDALRQRLLTPYTQRLDRGASLLEAFSFHNVLKRGFTVLRGADGAPLTAAKTAKPGPITVQFHDGTREGTLK